MNDAIKWLRESDDFLAGLLRDLIYVFAVVGIFMVVSQLLLGTYYPLVAVESGSMEPNMQIGDLVIKEGADHTTVMTREEGMATGYKSFGDYGDVILYQKMGQGGTPVIHRAMYFVEKGEPMWDGGPPAPYAGYITKGDNPRTNQKFDQEGSVSYMSPVKEEWVVGVARFRIPFVGYLPLTVHSIF
ncbi:MAG TPA: S26 family signal peptidase [Candidatus Methanoperedenaceae archaeon]|nr:S26 family signal peptidase [Candidatus Methanoperedenaceae archaeon]